MIICHKQEEVRLFEFFTIEKACKYEMYVITMSRTRFTVNLHSIAALMSMSSLLETRTIFQV